MKKILFLIIILISACTSNNLESDLNKDFVFSEQMSFDEFTSKVEIYANESSYPKLND